MFTSEMSQTEQPAIIRLLQEVEGTMVYMHIPRRVSIGELSAVFEANDLNILSFGVEPGMHKGSFCGYFLVTDNLDQPLTVQHQDQLIAALQRELHGTGGECGLRGGYVEMSNIHPGALEQIYKCASINLCPNTIGQ
ncbi:alanine aminotransferase, partial [Haematococcus lacustris]